MALVAVLIAFTGFLEVNARGKSDDLGSQAQLTAVRGMTASIGGQLLVNHDWSSAFQTWAELDDLRTTALLRGDNITAARYQAVRDRVQAVSGLLAPAYFDATVAEPDLALYESDVYLVQATVDEEHYSILSRRANAYGRIASTLVFHLTLLAVALFFYGLAVTSPAGSHTRSTFVAMGTVVIVVVMAWAAATVLRSPPSLSEEAIQSYAEAVGLSHQGRVDEAAEVLDGVLASEPSYESARVQRGETYLQLGITAMQDGDETTARDHFEAARDDLRQTTGGEAWRRSLWNLGWASYLLGDYDAALAADRRLLARDPDNISVRSNTALVLLAAGDLPGARSEFDRTLLKAEDIVAAAHAEGKTPPASFWLFLDAIALDYQNLADRLNGQDLYWLQAPLSTGLAAEPDQRSQTIDLAQTLFAEARSAALSLESQGRLAPQPAAARVTITDVSAPLDADGDVTTIRADYSHIGLTPGQRITWKLYIDDEELMQWRRSQAWTGPAEGSGAIEFSFSGSDYIFVEGRYDLEVFIDGRMVDRRLFVVP
jgi:tetratricopeptide (TPR) repeat protein